MSSDIKAVENYLATKLLENHIAISSDNFKFVINIFKGRDGWKQYIDRFVKGLAEYRRG